MVVARTQTIDSRAFTAEKPPRPTGAGPEVASVLAHDIAKKITGLLKQHIFHYL
jgi:hypothetical protein